MTNIKKIKKEIEDNISSSLEKRKSIEEKYKIRYVYALSDYPIGWGILEDSPLFNHKKS